MLSAELEPGSFCSRDHDGVGAFERRTRMNDGLVGVMFHFSNVSAEGPLRSPLASPLPTAAA